jgi:hypothetical protein
MGLSCGRVLDTFLKRGETENNKKQKNDVSFENK